MEIRGFPQLIYYASADEQASGSGNESGKVKAYKHQGERTLAALEAFAIAGGYKSVGLSGYIPIDQKAIQDWGRYVAMSKIKLM